MPTGTPHDLLTQTGPGTPGGDLFRRYWQPAGLSEDLPPGGAPVPVCLLGEDLVLFRDETGQPGLLGIHCSHRGADLSYGRLEDGGLRCIYHGWLYDRAGRCLEQPGEPTGSTFHERIHHLAYPCQERAGVIFAYLGPGEPPLLPNYEFLTVPDDHAVATKLLSECNYLQALDGALDPAHVSFLHRDLSGSREDPRMVGSAAPTIVPEETDFGMRLYMIRNVDADYRYVGITNFILPSANAFSGPVPRPGYSVNWFVPTDDAHHWRYTFNFDRETPLDRTASRRSQLPLTPDYRPVPNQANRYLQDRSTMATGTYSGIPMRLFTAQDIWATESAGPVQVRTQEHLATTDRGIVTLRNLLLRAIKEVEAGREPPHTVRSPEANQFPQLVTRNDLLPSSVDWRTYWMEAVPARQPASAKP